MTCIVGFTDKKNNVTWMGGDSLGSDGYSQAVNLAGKVFHNDILNNVVIGGNPAHIICSFEDYYEKNKLYNTGTKGLSSEAKMQVLLRLEDIKFIKKKMLNFK